MTQKSDNNTDKAPDISHQLSIGDDGELIAVPLPRKKKKGVPSLRVRVFRRSLLAALVVLFAAGLGYGAAQVVRPDRADTPIASPMVIVVPSGTVAPKDRMTDAQSLLLANDAEHALTNNNPDLALSLALRAADTLNPALPVQRALIEAAYAPGTRHMYPIDSGVADFSISRDGRLLAVVTYGSNKITLIDLTSEKTIRQIGPVTPGDDNRLNAVALSPDGRSIAASGGADTTITLWDTTTGSELHRLEGHSGPVTALAFSSDGKWLLSGGSDLRTNNAQGALVDMIDHTVRLWEVGTGKELHRFEGHSSSIAAVSFSPNNSLCYSIAADGMIIEWEISSGLLLNQYGGSGQFVFAGVVDPTGKYAAVGGMSTDMSQRGTTMLWPLGDNSDATPTPLTKHTQRVSSLAFSPDGRYLVSGGYDDLAVVWAVSTGQALQTYSGGQAMRISKVGFSPDGRSIFTGAEGSVNGIQGIVRNWSVASNAVLNTLRYSSEVTALANSPDGRSLFVGLYSGELILVDAATGNTIRHFDRQNGVIASASFSPDGRMVVTGTEAPHGQMTLWNTATGVMVKVFIGNEPVPSFKKVMFSPDGTTILSAGLQKAILWNSTTGQSVGDFPVSGNPVEDVAFSPDGLRVLIGLQDGEIQLWDTHHRQLINKFGTIRPNLASIAFSHDGKTAFAGYVDGTIRVWNTATGKAIDTLTSQPAAMSAIRDTPDGRYLISVSNATTDNVTLWDAQTGDVLYNYTDHSATVNSLAISPDGRTLFTGSNDKTISIAALPGSMDQLRTWIGQNRYVPDFSCDERQQYVIEPLCKP